MIRGVTDATCRSMLGKIGRLKNLSIHTPKQSLDELGAYRYGVKKAAAETVFLATKNVDTQVEIRLITARRYMQKNGCRAVKWPVAREQQGPFDVLIEKKLFLRSTDSRKTKDDCRGEYSAPRRSREHGMRRAVQAGP